MPIAFDRVLIRIAGAAALGAALSACAHAPPPAPPPVVTPQAAVALESIGRPALPSSPAPVQPATARPTRPPSPCSSLVRAAPAYPDSDAALKSAAGISDHLQILMAARKLRMERERQLEAALRRCVVSSP